MSRHVAPHRWADAWAGKLAGREVATMERHAAACDACARAKAQVQSASASFPELRAQTAPELPWDRVRAKIHWAVSSEKRAVPAKLRPRTLVLAGALAATAGLALGATALLRHSPAAPGAHAPLASAPPPSAHAAASAAAERAPSLAAPIAGAVTRVSGEVMVDGVRRTDVFDRTIAAGTVLATGSGRLDVQFGDASAFALGPRSTLEVHRFDAEQIELAITGTVDVVVAPRAAGQRFVVLAGDRTIEVRGTQFRVEQSGAGTHVACRHGLVAVRDRAGEVAVAAARAIDVPADKPVGDARVVVLASEQLAQLAHATPITTALWSNPAASTAVLELAAPTVRDVRLDGIELGEAPLRVRVIPGRHTVEAADAVGRYRRAGWIDAEPAHTAKLELPADAAPTGGAAARRGELDTHVDRARLARCVRAIAKSGLTETFVQIEIAVDGAGAVRFLNITDTDLGATGASCVRDVLADVRFGQGAAATWRERIEL